MKKGFIAAVIVVAMAVALVAVGLMAEEHKDKDTFEFEPDTLVLSRSVYMGTAGTVTIGQTLPPGCVAGTVTLPLIASGTTTVTVKCATAIDNGEYPNLIDNHNVWNNNGADGSFGISSPIFLDNLTTDGKLLSTLPIPTRLLVTSFSSKFELAVNGSTDRKLITLVAYHGDPGFLTEPNLLDVSNSNTPDVVDPTNPVVSQYYRSVAEVDAHGKIQVTDGNAYSGNNGRAAMKANWIYYITGNDNNAGLSSSRLTGTQIGKSLIASTGAELLVPGLSPPVPPHINMLGD